MPLLSVLRSLCRTFPVQKNVSRLRVNNSCLSPIAQSIQRTCVTSSDSKRLLCYERKADETLESLCDQTDEILCSSDALKDYDVNLSNGVLTIDLSHRGTYVINKQSVNQQIWLSSPVSGPKRFDLKNGYWVYERDGERLEHLISKELTEMLGKKVEINLDDESV